MSVLVTTNTTLSVEDDLDEAWAKVIKRLEDEAELVLPADHKTDDIAAIINPPKADPTTKTKVTEIYVKALKCIDRFGGMVAQVGSIVSMKMSGGLFHIANLPPLGLRAKQPGLQCRQLPDQSLARSAGRLQQCDFANDETFHLFGKTGKILRPDWSGQA